MNDILTDLRNAIVDDKHPWDVTIYERAIDEIERLRAELQRLNDCLISIYSTASFGVNGE